MRSCDVHLNDWCADVVVAIIAVVVIAVVDIAVVIDIANPSRRRVLRVRNVICGVYGCRNTSQIGFTTPFAAGRAHVTERRRALANLRAREFTRA